jgi:hypothetical protein
VVAFKVLMEIMQTQTIEFEKEGNKVWPFLPSTFSPLM